MEDLIDTLTRGNPTEVKVVLASVALALAVYQLVLISVGYGKVRPEVPDGGAGRVRPPRGRRHHCTSSRRSRSSPCWR